MKRFFIIICLLLFYFYSNSQKLDIGATVVSSIIENKVPSEQKYNDPDNIFEKINSYKEKYTLTNKFSGQRKVVYDNGIKTAINNSKITRFYIAYCVKNNKKITDFMPIPKLDSMSYNKLNDIIKLCNLDISSHRLIRSLCFNLMDCLLYEDYFELNFLYGNAHDVVNDLEVSNVSLFDNFTNPESTIMKILNYKDYISTIMIINKYLNYQ